MKIFPQLPISLMLQDYLRGKRSQLYLDSEGVHQYDKWLVRIRHAQQCAQIFSDNYKGLRKGDYNPLKLKRKLHDSLLNGLGFSLEYYEDYFIQI